MHAASGFFPGAWRSWHLQAACSYLKCSTIYYICHSNPFLRASVAGGTTRYAARIASPYMCLARTAAPGTSAGVPGIYYAFMMSLHAARPCQDNEFRKKITQPKTQKRTAQQPAPLTLTTFYISGPNLNRQPPTCPRVWPSRTYGMIRRGTLD